jgi:hypothetical protein
VLPHNCSIILTTNRRSDQRAHFDSQPPLPLQEFLPEQPLSPVLHPPLPLQEFFPAQECFSAVAAPAALLASFAAGALDFASTAGFDAVLVSAGLLSLQPLKPAKRPATASGTSELDVRWNRDFDAFIWIRTHSVWVLDPVRDTGSIVAQRDHRMP